MMGMAASHALALLMIAPFSAAPPRAGVPEEALRALRESTPAQQRQQATILVEEGQKLHRAGQWQKAVASLERAAEIDPTYAQPHIWLGYIHQEQYAAATTPEARGKHQTAAISAYAGALAIAPEDQYARSAQAGLLFAAEFPRTLDVAALAHTPVRFIVNNSRLTGVGEDGGAVKRGWAYTASVVFPPEHPDRTGVEVWPEDPRSLARYNRVCYGYVADPRSEQLQLRFAVHYPSPGLAQPTIDHTPLAHRVISCLLRLQCYVSAYLGQPEPAMGDEIVRVWLTDRGNPGGEQMRSNILLSDVDVEREPIEWIREVAHEYGHQVLPRIGYIEPLDEDASGLIGERLFLRWLAEDVLGAANARWPSAAARQGFDALWPPHDLALYVGPIPYGTPPQTGSEGAGLEASLEAGAGAVALGEFLASRCDEPVNFWLCEGPQSQRLGEQTPKAAEYFVGLVLYIEAAHGRPILADTLRRAEGQPVADFVKAYEDVVAAHLDRTPLALNAALFIPSESNIHSPPYRTLAHEPGALFSPEEHATYRVYLPAGRWRVRLEPGAPGASSFAVALDGEQEQGIVHGGEASAEGALFEAGTPGWHTLRIKLANADNRVRLLRALISAAPEEPKQTTPEPPVAEPRELPVPGGRPAPPE